MSSLIEDLSPTNWDGETYFRYIKERRELCSSKGSITLPNSKRLVALNAAIKKYETAAFLRQTQPTDIERD